ncbi:MAG TPA: aminotransferase class V-fold PLP-dependent enzyme, partial [Pirellulaceae bacterium]|nr:aminotransferase class V-fold PLP-dependent enzyme [Pirellulaceae bacterium]
DEIGGLERMAAINREKADLLYRALDAHRGFYVPHVEPAHRSLMNVVFRTASPQQDQQFVAAAKQHRLSDLKGHRSLGGMRASIYNAMPYEGVETLAQFIRDFAQQNG